jgi:hypothetical protein
MSAAEAARQLGTSVPRVKRAIERLGLDVQTHPGGRVQIGSRQFERLRRELGVRQRIGDLAPTEVAVLAALARTPLGLVSERAVATRAAVSPTSAGTALEQLEARGLVVRERTWLPAGRARKEEVIRANYGAADWPQLAPQLSKVEPPKARAPKPRRRQTVPPHLRHLFWNTAKSQLDVDRAGGYIARRLVQAGDVEGLAWGAANLRPDDWMHAARTRGLDVRDRALATNLAQAR